jgi:protein-disulfide isomerase
LLGALLLIGAGACGTGGEERARTSDTVRPAPAIVAVVTPAPAPARPAPSAPAPATAAPAGPRRVLLGDLDLTGVGHDVGSATAPVVIIDFSDYGCPYCGEFTRETYPTIEREYVRTGKVFFKYVPFIVGMFPHSADATRAVECAAEQGRFWPMLDRVYDAQKEWRTSSDPRALLTSLASAAGADTATLARCYADRHTDARIARATGLANQVGVRVTPSFIVNERPIEGALPLADFRRVIDAALLVATARK